MRLALVTIALAAAPLAGCGSDRDGTSITINAGGDDGNMVAGVDGNTGQVSLNVPGFKGSLTLPKIQLDAKDFDMNGVHLYPGSTIASMNIDGHDKGETDDDGGTVHVVFDSPADPATVRDWFKGRLDHAGFKVADDGMGLSGTTNEDKPFKLDLKPSDAGHSRGTITVSG